MSLEERMIQMGGDSSESNASRQQTGRSQVGTAATVWEQFVKNIDAYDKQVNTERQSTVEQHSSETFVREVYQPTTVVEGRRVDGSGRAVQRRHLLERGRRTSASATNLHTRLENLMLAVESPSHPAQSNTSVQSPRVQQTRTENASLLDSQILVDTDALAITHEVNSTLGYPVMPHTPIQPLISSVGSPAINTVTSTSPANANAASAEPVPSHEETEEDWLIQF